MIDRRPPLDSEARKKKQRQRNWAVFIALCAFVILVYAITMVKIKLGYGQ
jgi:hypothetical protein